MPVHDYPAVALSLLATSGRQTNIQARCARAMDVPRTGFQLDKTPQPHESVAYDPVN